MLTPKRQHKGISDSSRYVIGLVRLVAGTVKLETAPPAEGHQGWCEKRRGPRQARRHQQQGTTLAKMDQRRRSGVVKEPPQFI
jgi:hypothetical protein